MKRNYRYQKNMSPRKAPKDRACLGANGGSSSEPLIAHADIQTGVELVGKIITDYYIREQIENVVFVSILHGACKFVNMLKDECVLQPAPIPSSPRRREYNARFQIRDSFIGAKSQMKGGTRHTPAIYAHDLDQWKDTDFHFLICDDLIETGETVLTSKNAIARECGLSKEQVDQRVRTATFIWKPNIEGQVLKPDWYVYRTSNHYLAGFGMDGCEGMNRHLPMIFVHDNRPEHLGEPSWAFRFDDPTDHSLFKVSCTE